MSLSQKITLTLTLLFNTIILAKEPLVQIDFDSHNTQYQGIVIPETPKNLFEAQQHSFAEGLTGRAIDFSEDGTIGMPLKLKPELELEYHSKTPLTIQLWVKTKPDAGQGTPIAGNKKDKNIENKGWLLYAEEDGSWSLTVSASFTDTYRTTNPKITKETLGYTWTSVALEFTYESDMGFVPINSETNPKPEYRNPFARKDFINSIGNKLLPLNSTTIVHHNSNLSRSFPEFPSDLGAVLTTFKINPNKCYP